MNLSHHDIADKVIDNLKLYQYDGDIPFEAILVIFKKLEIPILEKNIFENGHPKDDTNHNIAKYHCFKLKEWYSDLTSHMKNGKITPQIQKIDQLVEAFSTCKEPQIFHFNLGYVQMRSQFKPHEDYIDYDLLRSTLSLPGGYHEIKRHFKGHYWP